MKSGIWFPPVYLAIDKNLLYGKGVDLPIRFIQINFKNYLNLSSDIRPYLSVWPDASACGASRKLALPVHLHWCVLIATRERSLFRGKEPPFNQMADDRQCDLMYTSVFDAQYLSQFRQCRA